jgi:hypothetical protein
MNMNLKLSLNPKALMKALRLAQPYLFGAALVAVFAYTAYVVNGAMNVMPAPRAADSGSSTTKITFDKKTIEALKNLDNVSGAVPAGALGSEDPFR